MSKQEMELALEAICALGVIGDGYCFCSKDRDPDKRMHEPECRDVLSAIAALKEAIKQHDSEPLVAGDERRHVICVCPDCASRVAHVICCNDSVMAVTFGTEEQAEAAMEPFIEADYRRYLGHFKDGVEYLSRMYWHVHTVKVTP